MCDMILYDNLKFSYNIYKRHIRNVKFLGFIWEIHYFSKVFPDTNGLFYDIAV